MTAFFARSGLYDAMRGGDDGEVPQARPAQGDNTAGLALVAGILAALRLAERTGEGQVIETSLFETAVWTQSTDFGVVAVDKAPVRRRSAITSWVPSRTDTLRRWQVGGNQPAGSWQLRALRQGARQGGLAGRRALRGR